MLGTHDFVVHETCPYLNDRESTIEVSVQDFSPGSYEKYLTLGWRRSGSVFYRYICNGCSQCVPIRLTSANLSLTDRCIKIIAKNEDVSVNIMAPKDKDEYFQLYKKYQTHRHDPFENPDRSEFRSLLQYTSSAITEYRTRDGLLIALGFIDLLPDGISSVYFAFDPEQKRRSLGYFSILRESGLAMQLGKKWYYLGFWVPGSKKMDYKAEISPFQIAPRPRQSWIDASDRSQALSYLSGKSNQP